jgi:hypothetical protein
VILDLLDGQYKNSVRVVAFNTAEKWSQDVSADVAQDLRQRCDLQMRDVPFFLQDFVDCHEGRYRDVQLPLPMPGLNDRHRAKPQVRDSHYNSGRGNDWVKVTRRQRETLPLAGFALKENRFDGLYIGRQEGDELIYKHLQARLKPLIRKTQSYAEKIVHRSVRVEPHCSPKSSIAPSRPP